MERLSHVFKALSDPLRLRIINQLLANGKEAYGEELANALAIPAYQLSRHLKVLKTTGLIHERREGRWVYYSLTKNGGGGHLLTALRRLLAESAEPVDGNGGQGRASRSRAKGGRETRATNQSSTESPVSSQPVNWDPSSAVPGIRE